MITDQEVDKTAKEFELRPLDVQKDYVYGWLLKGIYERPALASQLVLKGGNDSASIPINCQFSQPCL